MRVYEAAKELGCTAAVALQGLKDIGEYVRSAQSMIEVPVLDNLAEHLGLERNTEPEVSSATAEPKSSGLRPPECQVRRDNNPVKPGCPSSKSATTSAVWTSDRQSEDQQFMDATHSGASPSFAHVEWKMRGFTDVERDVWLAAGLRSYDARAASVLRDGGLRPVDLTADVNGWTVLERIRKGEGAGAVVRLFCRSRDEVS